MSMLAHFRQCREAFGPNLYYDFMLAYAREYTIGPDTFAGPRGEQHGCFMNATHLALWNQDLTYVEGKIEIHGVPIDHAWCIDANDTVVDPTVVDVGQITGYCGVPFKIEYVKRAMRLNKRYGVLDIFYAGKTAPKLFELGLEAGQQWLIDQERNKRKRRVA